MPWECNNSDDTTQRFKSGNLGKPGRDCLPRQEDVLSTDRRAVAGDNSRSPPWRDGICFCPLAINTTPAVGSISYCGMNGGWGQQWKDSQLWLQPPGPPWERRIPSVSRFPHSSSWIHQRRPARGSGLSCDLHGTETGLLTHRTQ